MFGAKSSGGQMTSLISKGTRVQGDIEFSDHMEIEGELIGNIGSADGDGASLRVAEGGVVRGEIRVPNIIINGFVEGNVFASEHLELASKAKIEGTIYYRTMEMVKGATLTGQLRQIEAEHAASFVE
jgi:cytoskeletal protein CcmA (bactofilin family)